MRTTALLILAIMAGVAPLLPNGGTYEMSFELTGNARGTILLLFPYRVYYTANAALLFTPTPEPDGSTLFRLEGVGRTGYMMRTLGFSGKSLGILTADNDRIRAKGLSENLFAKFGTESPSYSRVIKKVIWNNFSIGQAINRITFRRTSDGIHRNITYNLKLALNGSEKPLKISFNIYRILAEIIRAYNTSYLPVNMSVPDLVAGAPKSWRSKEMDFSDILASSAVLAAGIFRKIAPLHQSKPFTAVYSVSSVDGTFIIIKGEAEPDISIWGSFRIRTFSREVKIRINDNMLISDRIMITVDNNSDDGGRFSASLILTD